MSDFKDIALGIGCSEQQAENLSKEFQRDFVSYMENSLSYFLSQNYRNPMHCEITACSVSVLRNVSITPIP